MAETKTVEGKTLEELAENVNRHLDEGWRIAPGYPHKCVSQFVMPRAADEIGHLRFEMLYSVAMRK